MYWSLAKDIMVKIFFSFLALFRGSGDDIRHRLSRALVAPLPIKPNHFGKSHIKEQFCIFFSEIGPVV